MGRTILGQVSSIMDSGEDIFSEAALTFFFEIFEWGAKFLGQVSFIRDSGRIVFLEVVSKLFGIFPVGRKIESG